MAGLGWPAVVAPVVEAAVDNEGVGLGERLKMKCRLCFCWRRMNWNEKEKGRDEVFKEEGNESDKWEWVFTCTAMPCSPLAALRRWEWVREEKEKKKRKKVKRKKEINKIK